MRLIKDQKEQSRAVELRLELLGGLRLTQDGVTITGWGYAKTQALLCYRDC